MTGAEINLLQESFPFITEEIICNLVEEKDRYYTTISGVDVEHDLDGNKGALPHWHHVAKDVELLQPPSAFMEWVFSLLRALMDEREESSFNDHIAASFFLEYNRGRSSGKE